MPQTTIIGIEPKDLETLSEELTPEIEEKVDQLIQRVLEEVASLGGEYSVKEIQWTDWNYKISYDLGFVLDNKYLIKVWSLKIAIEIALF